MLYEEVEDADLEVLDLGDLLCDMVGDEVGAAGLGRERDRLLEPGHVGFWRVGGCARARR